MPSDETDVAEQDIEQSPQPELLHLAKTKLDRVECTGRERDMGRLGQIPGQNGPILPDVITTFSKD